MLADSIYLSDNIFTGNSLETVSGAVVIADNTILDVCAREEAGQYQGPETTVFDCGDKLIAPGFHDGHHHIFQAIALMNDAANIDMRPISSLRECMDTITAYAASHHDSEWVSGFGWNSEIWEDCDRKINRHLLDELLPDRPAFLVSWDGHSAWVNTKTLEIMNYTKKENIPDDCVVTFDEEGMPDGIVKEVPGMRRIAAHLPERYAGMLDTLRDVIKAEAGCGITSCSDLWPPNFRTQDNTIFESLKEVEKNGDLLARFHVFPQLKEDLSEAKAFRKKYNSSMVRVAGLKEIIDGTFEVHTAFTVDDYANDPGYRSEPQIPAEKLNRMVINADKEGFSCRFHSIGSGAVRMALDSFEAAIKVNGKKNLHHAVEHAETIAEQDFERFGKMGIVASMQPTHSMFSVDIYEGIVGKQLHPYYPWRKVKDNGAILAFGSDKPAIPEEWFPPLYGIFTAVTRTSPEGYPEGGFEPSQRLTVAEALQAYTIGPAIAANYDHMIGTLEAGKFADLVVLDRNLLACQDKPQEILDAKVLLTMMDGKITYQDESF